MPKTKSFQQRLESAYPYETYANTLRALREGVAAGDDVIKGTPMFSTEVGDDYRGLIRRAGILQRFAEMCKAGDLSFKCALTPMPRGTWHWLDIFSGDCHGHIVRTEDPMKFPEDTPNRQDARASNMPNLFETEEERIIRLSPPKLYTWLTYRAAPDGRLSHALWQAPSANTDEWLARINLMAVTVMKKSDDATRPAKVDPKSKMKLRDNVVALIETKKKNDDTKR
ncbi:MAG TPA: hypothetical protein VFC45_07175 [Pseudolabrys sp.]|nr:hypothetical protein [Pseudolabrys sp.]